MQPKTSQFSPNFAKDGKIVSLGEDASAKDPLYIRTRRAGSCGAFLGVAPDGVPGLRDDAARAAVGESSVPPGQKYRSNLVSSQSMALATLEASW